MTLPAVGASVCASGNHVCTGHTGSFMANAMKKRKKTIWAGISRSVRLRLPISVISKVPVEKKSTSIPISISADPEMVKMRNFMAEYSLRPVPQTEIRKYMGTSSNSQKMKNRTKSKDMKTPNTAVCNTRSQKKCSLTLSFTFQDANTADSPSSPVKNTNGALKPSTLRKY